MAKRTLDSIIRHRPAATAVPECLLRRGPFTAKASVVHVQDSAVQVNGWVTAEQYILEEQRRRYPHATGEFSWLLSGITLASKMVAANVRRAGLNGVLGETDQVNVQGEVVQQLDVYANNALINALGTRGNVGVLASEENDEPVVVLQNPKRGKYVVVFDPLDGSSNIDVNVSVGTIFSILGRTESNRDDPARDVLQAGLKQIAAGYVLYGSSTMLVYSTGNGVHGFTLDPAIGVFVLSHPNIQMPPQGTLYSVNEANADSFPEFCRRYLHWLKSGDERTPIRSATSVRWWPISTARCSKGASFCIRLLRGFPTANCACSTKPIRLPFSQNKPAAWPATGRGGSWKSTRPKFINARRCSSAANTKWSGSKPSPPKTPPPDSPGWPPTDAQIVARWSPAYTAPLPGRAVLVARP